MNERQKQLAIMRSIGIHARIGLGTLVITPNDFMTAEFSGQLDQGNVDHRLLYTIMSEEFAAEVRAKKGGVLVTAFELLGCVKAGDFDNLVVTGPLSALPSSQQESLAALAGEWQADRLMLGRHGGYTNDGYSRDHAAFAIAFARKARGPKAVFTAGPFQAGEGEMAAILHAIRLLAADPAFKRVCIVAPGQALQLWQAEAARFGGCGFSKLTTSGSSASYHLNTGARRLTLDFVSDAFVNSGRYDGRPGLAIISERQFRKNLAETCQALHARKICILDD